MNSQATLEFINKAQFFLTPYEYDHLKYKLLRLPEKFRKAFLIILFSGYSVESAFVNFEKIYDFAEENSLDYGLAIRLISNTAQASQEGLFINDLTRYELN
jgi:hypothetical protein